jgi:hypothetical protein
MKVSCALVVCLLVVVAAAGPARAQSQRRVRALDDTAAAALDRGLAHSPLFRRLIADLEASDLIVHVITGISLPANAAGATRLASPGLRDRYVRVTISGDIPRAQRPAILAHELQHACEIARSQARDTAAIRMLFQTIGKPGESPTETYETDAAIKAGIEVWLDLIESPLRMR